MSGKGGFGGCLAQILGMGLIIAIIGIVDACQHSQTRLIKEARKGNTFYDYQNYLDKYPTGRYAAEAYDSVVSLWDAMKFENFQEIYLDAPEDIYHKGAIVKYKKLLAEYSDPSFQTKLRRKMESKCREQYNIAIQMNTLDGWAHYIAHVPESFLFDAQWKYDDLHKNAWGTEKTAWEYACSRNTVADYEEYERLFPNGKHVKEAEKRAVSIRVENLFIMDHGSLPAMNKTSNGRGASSTVIVENATSYVMTIYYSGTDGKRLTITPHGRQSVVLANGFYRIAASVNDVSVRPFAGTENLTGGEYNVQYYIKTTRY